MKFLTAPFYCASKPPRGRLPRAGGLVALLMMAGLFLLSACALTGPGEQPSPSPSPAAPSPSPTFLPSPTLTSTLTLTPTPAGTLPVWGRYAAPRGSLATAIPPPMPTLAQPSEVRAILFAGLDRPNPYPGRSDALMLLIYHPRLSKAALVSIPPDLFGYLPGQTMQRLYSAYPLGGARLLQLAIEYNLGIRPDAWLVIHTDDFGLLVDELGGITVPVMEDIPNLCGDILYQGDVPMNGTQALCYVRLRLGPDEFARGLRQQQVLSVLLERLVSGGGLLKLPELFSLFHSRIDTNLSGADALSAISLGLRLSDPNRVAYFKIGKDQVSLWQISQQPPATVFLPRRESILTMLDEAFAFVNKPSPLSDIVLTREAQLTASPTAGPPGTPTRPSSTLTRTVVATRTSQPTGSLTPSLTPTPTITLTHTATFSP